MRFFPLGLEMTSGYGGEALFIRRLLSGLAEVKAMPRKASECKCHVCMYVCMGGGNVGYPCLDWDDWFESHVD